MTQESIQNKLPEVQGHPFNLSESYFQCRESIIMIVIGVDLSQSGWTNGELIFFWRLTRSQGCEVPRQTLRVGMRWWWRGRLTGDGGPGQNSNLIVSLAEPGWAQIYWSESVRCSFGFLDVYQHKAREFRHWYRMENGAGLYTDTFYRLKIHYTKIHYTMAFI